MSGLVSITASHGLQPSTDWILTSSGDRKYGWAPLNMTPMVSEEFKRSKSWSLLPALTIQGYLSWIILQGSVTQEIFIDFVRDHVLPYCGSFDRGDVRLAYG